MNFFAKIGLVFALATSSVAMATPITDVKQHSNNKANEFFVDSDANKFNSPFYRGASADWGWVHNAIAGTFSSIKLQISAFDVDFSQGERDLIQVFDGSSWLSLGNLMGTDSQWEFTTFDLSGYSWATAQVNAGLRLRMDIDTASSGWVVTLGKSTLSVDGGSQQCVPTPGVPCSATVSAPGSVGVLALGGMLLWLRRRVAA